MKEVWGQGTVVVDRLIGYVMVLSVGMRLSGIKYSDDSTDPKVI